MRGKLVILILVVGLSNSAHGQTSFSSIEKSYCLGLKRTMDDPLTEFNNRKRDSITDCVKTKKGRTRAECTTKISALYTPKLMDDMLRDVEKEWSVHNCRGKI